MDPVKLYVADWYREPGMGHISLMFPFWGVPDKASLPFTYAAMQKYQYSKRDFTLAASIQEADFVLIPHKFWRLKGKNPQKVDAIRAEAKQAGKPLLIDAAGDIEFPVPFPEAVVLRLSQYRYAVSPNEITIPFGAEDLLETYLGGTLEMRKKAEKPSVSFTGWAKMGAVARTKTFVKELPVTLGTLLDRKRSAEHKGILFRERALSALAGNPRVDARILRRSSYSGHIATIQGSVEDIRREFVENLNGADYALCVRGDANASIRFYEALSLGRIPLFLDTACVLPLEGKLEYRNFCVFVDHTDIARIGDALADFHAACTPERFEDMQKKARDAFRKYLREDVFSGHLAGMLRERAARFRTTGHV